MLNSHTHCQVALANAKAKTWQRVCLSNRTIKTPDKPTDEKEHRSDNSVYVAIAGELVNRKSVHLRNFVPNGKESASHPLLHIHAKRCTQAEKRASRTLGTFGFCRHAKPTLKKPKEPNFSQRSTEIRILTKRNKRYK